MFLLLDKQNVILHISETLTRDSGGNYVVDNGALAFAPSCVYHTAEVERVLDGVCAQQYTYDGTSFAENANYTAPKSETEKLQAQVDDWMDAIIELGALVGG